MNNQYDNKFARIMRKIYQIIILNIISVITIILGLGIFSLLPTLCSLVACFKSCDDDTIKDMFVHFFKVFKKVYVKSELVFLFFFVLIFLGSVSVFYFYSWLQESPTLGFVVMYYVTLFIEGIFILSLINSSFVLVYYPHLKYIKVIKYSIQLLMAVTLKFFIIFLLIIGCIYLGVIFVISIPFFAISLFMYICFILLDKPYTRLIPNGYEIIDPKKL